MVLRDYKYEQQEEIEAKPQISYYQDYQTSNENSHRLKELLFFLNIAIFSIACVLATFVFLSWNMNSVLSLGLSLPTGLLTLQVFRTVLKQKNKRKNKR